ncbi:MAG: hypothetical protein WB763_17765 [Terriglobia bacterium]|jgi:hypothetical protein
MQQWNLAVQRQFASDLMLEVDYVGNEGTKMPLWWSPNIALPGPGPVQPRLRWPQWQSSFTDFSNATSNNYSGLQARLEKRFSHGVQFLATYAWGHTLGVAGQSGLDGAPMNSRDFAQDYGDANIDIRQIFTASYIYQLPFGRGQRFLSSPNGIVNQVIGGWELTGITRYNSGSPYTVGIGIDQANVGTTNQRPSAVPGVPVFLSTTNKINSGLNPAAFAMPALYTWGTLGRNTLRTPGYSNWDIGLFKNFPLHGEKETLQFRTEFFNAFNNVSMGGPNSTYCQPLPACNAQFGLISGTQSTPREIQFALKLLF